MISKRADLGKRLLFCVSRA